MGLAADLAQRVLPQDLPLTIAALPGAEEMPSAGVTLLHGDMLLSNLSSASMLYLNPPCLPCDVQRKLVQKILTECHAEYVLTTTALSELLESGVYVEERTEMLRPM